MMRGCFLLLIYLLCGTVEPLLARENSRGFLQEEPRDSLLLQADSLLLRTDSLRNNDRHILQEPSSDIQIKLVENRLTIENLAKDGVLEVYNIMGAKVYSRRIRAGTSALILSLPKGYYIIKIGKFTRKISIK